MTIDVDEGAVAADFHEVARRVAVVLRTDDGVPPAVDRVDEQRVRRPVRRRAGDHDTGGAVVAHERRPQSGGGEHLEVLEQQVRAGEGEAQDGRRRATATLDQRLAGTEESADAVLHLEVHDAAVAEQDGVGARRAAGDPDVGAGGDAEAGVALDPRKQLGQPFRACDRRGEHHDHEDEPARHARDHRVPHPAVKRGRECGERASIRSSRGH